MIVAFKNETDVTCVLLQKGINVNKRLKDGLTAFHCTAYNYSTNVLRVLLEHGASAIIIDDGGCTSIDTAYECNNKEAVRQLEQY